MKSLPLLALLLLPASLFALAGSGTISSAVSDSSGAVMPSATVVASNEATGFKRQSVVTSGGDFSLVGLQPGEYTVNVEMQGFKRYSAAPRT